MDATKFKKSSQTFPCFGSGKKEKAMPSKEDKLRQLLWETTPELKKLRQMLLHADVAKNQALQMAEKRAIAELLREEEISRREEEIRLAKEYQDEQHSKEIEEQMAKREYHQVLDDLVRFKMSQGTSIHEENRKEREAIDAIKKQIEEEEQQLTKQKMERQKELQRQADELKQLRYQLRLEDRLKDKKLDAQVDEYRKAQELRSRHQEIEKQFNLEQRLRLQDELLSRLEKMYREKLDFETLRTDLAVAEREAAEKHREIYEDKKRKQLRKELEEIYAVQMMVKKQRDDLEKREDELYRQKMIEKLYEEDKLELMSQQKRRQKKIQHMRAAQAMVEEKQRLRTIAAEKELADQKFHDQQEKDRIRNIEEEKARFLQEHARELLGYLPKGVFSDEKMVEKLGEEFKRFYSRTGCSKRS